MVMVTCLDMWHVTMDFHNLGSRMELSGLSLWALEIEFVSADDEVLTDHIRSLVQNLARTAA